jgi:hypothetical protein
VRRQAGDLAVVFGACYNERIILLAPPMANPFMSIAAKEDIELDRFGDGTGTLEI